MSDQLVLDPDKTYAANRFPGTCINCGARVGKGQGVVASEGGKWHTLHRGTCPPPSVRVNAYAQNCEMCGVEVPPGMGSLERSDAGKWAVYHLGGCTTEFPFPDGRYAIRFEPSSSPDRIRDTNSHGCVPGECRCPRAYKRCSLFTDWPEKSADPEVVRFYHCTQGQVYLMASDKEILISPHRAKGIVEKIAQDSLAAAKLYGVEFEQCGVCGRGLTSEWRKVGIGPVCAQKGWG